MKMINLIEEQLACIDAISGSYVVLAGPGSGKTTVLIQRYLKMMMSGIPTADMLNLTFTHSAAQEMASRSGILDSKSVFRTFHSFALDMLKNERDKLPFETCDTIIPVELQDYQLMFDLVKTYPAINWRTLQDRIASWKCSAVSPDQAIDESQSNGLEYFYAHAYRDYEIKCRQQGWLDFSSLMEEAVKMLENNEEVRNRYKRDYIAVDEAQDCDEIQFRMLKLLFNGNIFAVGDENQCQPPGTRISVVRRESRGRKAAIIESVSIESLQENDRLLSWDSHGKRLRFGSGRRFRLSKRNFNGHLLCIRSAGHLTKVTPDHRLWVKFNKKAFAKSRHFVYLMWKEGLGFRVGVSSIRSNGRGGNQISHRGIQEKANKMWILSIVSTRAEAGTLEEIYSIRYGIPQSMFRSYNGSSRSDEQLKRIFKSVSEDGGFRCLKDFGLLFHHPLVSWPSPKHLTKFHGYFKTVAANVLSGIMDLPTETPFKSALIDRITIEKYQGLVYSLDVEKDHTYVADGIPVGNCIYEWRNAKAKNLSNFARVFPGAQVLYLGTNHRSTGNIVQFLKEILPVDNGLASRMTTYNEPGVPIFFTQYADEEQEVEQVIKKIHDPEHSAIIARTNRQLFIYQRYCTMRGIKYHFLGKKDYWDQSEVKKLLGYAKNSHDPRPANVVLTDLINQHNLIHIYSQVSKENPMESSPIENLNSIVKMAAGKGTTKEFLNYLRKLTHARKGSKGLTLSTVHQSKGRQWGDVFVIGANQGTMPHKDGELNEEARIFFVGASRAAKVLHISFHKQPSMYLLNYRDQIVEFQSE